MTNTDQSKEKQVEVAFENPEAAIASKAHAAKESKEFDGLIRRLVEAREEVDSGPVTVLLALYKLYSPEMEGFPIPDSDEEGANEPQGKVSIPYLKKDGSWGSRKGDWYSIFAHETGFGGQQFRRYEQLKEAVKDSPDATKITLPDVAELFNSGESMRLYAEHDKAKKRSQNVVKYIKNAAKLHFAVDLIMELEGVEVEYELDGDGNVITSQNPVTVASTKNRKQFKTLSPFQVIKIGKKDIVAIVSQLKAEDQYPRLMKFLNKGAGAETGTKGLKAATLGQAIDMVQAVSSFFDVGTKEGRERISALQKVMVKKDGEEFLIALGDLKATLRDIVTDDHQVRYERLSQDRTDATAHELAEAAQQPKKQAAGTKH